MSVFCADQFQTIKCRQKINFIFVFFLRLFCVGLLLLLLFSELLLLPLLLALAENSSNTLAGGSTPRQTVDRLPVIHGSVDALVGN